jgi:hypothetical protein
VDHSSFPKHQSQEFTHAENPLAKRLWANLRAGDWLIMILFIALAAGSFWFGGFVKKEEAEIALVTVSNRPVATVNLKQPTDFTVRGALGEVILQVANHRIRVLRSTCPNQVCVRQGEVYRPGEMLVCVPNHLLVFVRGHSDSNGKMILGDSLTSDLTKQQEPKQPFDAVTY